ncbi:MAG: lipid A deacylase LpxR family protein [Betaproteobacteria bacterium]|nr:lipid A deacylase LpxR family protein [Betaproteobacteria bacterium]PWB62313.1 MAG: DUF2219 domain-containing protein [Betaproteobacteria bacterium]
MSDRRQTCLIRASTLAAALCLALPAAAADAPKEGVWNLLVENDLFYGTDRNYTSGVGLAWVSGEKSPPDWAVRIARGIPWFPEGGTVRHGYVVGQNMYTPADISLPDPPRDDRPYAGWLYATIGLGVVTDGRTDQLSLTAGVVGPASLAEQGQKAIHRLIGSPEPKGWDTQLRNEPGLVLSYETRWRGFARGELAGLEFDVVPHLGAALGNIHTYANGGFTLRYGKRLASDLGPPRIRPSPPGSGFFVPADTFSWYVFAAVDGRAVARSIFLDGNTFKESRSVDKEYLVGDLQWGLEMTWKGVRVSYTHVRRTREFRTQGASSEFGAFGVSVAF